MTGRTFRRHRIVRLTDVTTQGRLRMDAVALYLGDVAEDDVEDAGYTEPVGWLVRRTVLTIRRWPAMGERVSLATSCSGVGPRWAERTTELAAADGPAMSAVALWVAVDPLSGRPARLGPQFHRIFAPSASGHRPSARLTTAAGDLPPADTEWPLRTSDFDVYGHVNNAVHWALVEDELARTGCGWLPGRAELEYHQPIVTGAPLMVGHRLCDDRLEVTMAQGGRLAAAALLAPRS